VWLCIACNVRVDYLFGEQWTQTTSKWGHPYPPNTPILGACGASFLAPSVIDLAPIQTSWIRHCLPCDRRRSYSANTGHDLDRPVTLDTASLCQGSQPSLPSWTEPTLIRSTGVSTPRTLKPIYIAGLMQPNIFSGSA